MSVIVSLVCASLIYAQQDGVPFRDDGFDRNRLIRDTTGGYDGSFYIGGSYTLSYVSAPQFSRMSGVYLTTLAYQFDFPLEISMDIGAENVFFHKEREKPPFPEDSRNGKSAGFLLPRIGLEYRPTPNTFLSIQFINERDAMRAYSPWHYWYRDLRYYEY